MKGLVPFSLHISLLGSWRYKVSPYSFLSQVHSQLFLRSLLHLPNHCTDPLLHLLQWWTLVFLFTGSPNMAPVLQIQCYECLIQWNKHSDLLLPQPGMQLAFSLFARILILPLKKPLSSQSAPRLRCCWDYSSPRQGVCKVPLLNFPMFLLACLSSLPRSL